MTTLVGPWAGSVRPRHKDLAALSREIGQEVAAQTAEAVDRQARFPNETIEACSEAGMLSALVPQELGGWGASIRQVGDSIFAIARHCASSGMILAMHHLQVACLMRHGSNRALRQYQEEVAELQPLLASATTEIHTGGQLRTSSCAVERDQFRFRLTKQAPVISYGAYADAVLVTARRDTDSPASDQVLVLCPSSQLTLEQTSGWDSLGLRGTCSSGFVLRATGDLDNVFPVPFDEIAARTMVPVSHILWGFVWLGLAAGATTQARSSVQARARKQPGTLPPNATRLAELLVAYRQLQAMVHHAADRFGRLDGVPAGHNRPEYSGPGHMTGALASNSLKVAASSAVVDIVTRAMGICGIDGYRQDSPSSLGRHLRDAHGSVLMVSNDRILADNAHLLLVDREEL